MLKPDLRLKFKELRTYFHQKFEDPNAFVRNLDALFELKPSHVVAGFWPVQTEPDILPLLHHLVDQNVRVALPVVRNESQVLIFRQWTPETTLEEGPHNIPQPGEDAPHLMPTHVLVPCLAYDEQGVRLGYGGGYYDRTLSALMMNSSITTIGVCYDDLTADTLPKESTDVPVQYILTEKRGFKVQ